MYTAHTNTKHKENSEVRITAETTQYGVSEETLSMLDRLFYNLNNEGEL